MIPIKAVRVTATMRWNEKNFILISIVCLPYLMSLDLYYDNLNTGPAVVAEWFRSYDRIQVDCNLKTQVWIPLGVTISIVQSQ